MIYATGIIIALFLSFILLSKNDKSKSDWILFAWLLTIALNLTIYSIPGGEPNNRYSFLLGWSFPLPLLHWPFLFLYVTSLTTKRAFTIKMFVHFIPFFLSIALFSKFLFLPGTAKIEIYKNQGRGYETQMTINLLAIILSATAYTLFSIITLWRYKVKIKDEFSYLEKINLNWLIYLISGMTATFLIIASGGSDSFIYTTVVGFVIFIGYFGVKQMGIFTQKERFTQNFNTRIEEENKNLTTSIPNFPEKNIEKERIPDTEINKSKYQKSTLTEDAALKIYGDLCSIMLAEKLFKNAELTLDELANALHVLPNHLSQVINSIEKKNFYDYINKLRIQEFIHLVSLPENQQFTLISLAFECGFNSKTSFNRNFKKVTGFTPSEYIKQENIKIAG